MRRARVDRADDQVAFEIEAYEPGELADGEVRIDVSFSGLNYKDAMAATGHPGVVRDLPITPGIDAAGVVAASNDPRFEVGDQVIATGHDFGVARDGGWQHQLDAPADWLVKLPEPLTLQNAMIMGTAGFTAMQCVDQLRKHDVTPEAGEVLVTGATGGVGSVAVALLAKAGYTVVASTGKTDRHRWLKELGAAECISRDEAAPASNKPLARGRWAGAVDTVGGAALTAAVKSLKPSGAVAACGVVGGHQLDLTVYPFILRGVALVGIDSAWHDMQDRRRIWDTLATSFEQAEFERFVDRSLQLGDLTEAVERILKGGVCGRTLLRL